MGVRRSWGDDPWFGLDDLGWGLAFVPFASVGSLPVVVGDVVVEVGCEPGDGGFDVLDEGGLVELFEDGALDSFDFAVGLGAAGSDASVVDAEPATTPSGDDNG